MASYSQTMISSQAVLESIQPVLLRMNSSPTSSSTHTNMTAAEHSTTDQTMDRMPSAPDERRQYLAKLNTKINSPTETSAERAKTTSPIQQLRQLATSWMQRMSSKSRISSQSNLTSLESSALQSCDSLPLQPPRIRTDSNSSCGSAAYWYDIEQRLKQGTHISQQSMCGGEIYNQDRGSTNFFEKRKKHFWHLWF